MPPIGPIVVGLPGLREAKTASYRVVFLSVEKAHLPGGRYLDGTKARDTSNTGDTDRLQAGTIIGKLTAAPNDYANSIIGLSTVALTTVATTLQTTAAVAQEIVRRIGTSGTFKLIGPPSAAGTVATTTVTFSAVNTSTGAITITATGVAYVANSIIAPTDGSEAPITFISDVDGDPVIVTDSDGTSLPRVELPKFPIGGVVISNNLIFYSSLDSSLKTWLKQQISTALGPKFVFDDNL